MTNNKYFTVKITIETNNGLIYKNSLLYYYHAVNNECWFKNTNTASLAVILQEKEINKYLSVCNSVDKLKLFHIHSKNILNDVLPMYNYLPTAGKYVIDDLKAGKIDSAFYALQTDIDKIRHSYLGETLKIYCIDV